MTFAQAVPRSYKFFSNSQVFESLKAGSAMASMVSSWVRYCSSESYANDRRFKSVSPRIVCKHHSPSPPQSHDMPGDPFHRREVLLRTSELAVLAAILNLGGKKPDYLGVQKNQPALALCPATRNCISTSEDISDLTHYAPPWNYNPEEGRGRKNPVSREVAIQELLQVIKSTKPDNFTPKIVEQKDDYVRVEYESPVLGFVDDVEFWFPPGKKSIVEYRSASRLGNYDFDVNRKRIKVIRLALEKKGWASAASF